MNGPSFAKGVIAYLIMAFGLAWGAWLIPLCFGLGLGKPSFIPFLIVGAFAPAIAAIVVRKWVTREGFADAGLRLNLRGNKRFYLVAWLLPLAVVAGIILLAIAFNVARPDFALSYVLEKAPLEVGGAMTKIPVPLRFPLVSILQGLIVALIATPILWGEEFGWRGYLQNRLFRGRPLLAAIVTGLIWGVWHYPINLQGYNFPEDTKLGLIVFPISTVLLSIVFGWLMEKTGSVWTPSLAHAATNAVGAGATVVLFMGQPNWILTSYVGVLAWIPLGALCAWIVITGQLEQNMAEESDG